MALILSVFINMSLSGLIFVFVLITFPWYIDRVYRPLNTGLGLSSSTAHNQINFKSVNHIYRTQLMITPRLTWHKALKYFERFQAKKPKGCLEYSRYVLCLWGRRILSFLFEFASNKLVQLNGPLACLNFLGHWTPIKSRLESDLFGCGVACRLLFYFWAGGQGKLYLARNRSIWHLFLSNNSTLVCRHKPSK